MWFLKLKEVIIQLSYTCTNNGPTSYKEHCINTQFKITNRLKNQFKISNWLKKFVCFLVHYPSIQVFQKTHRKKKQKIQ